MSNSGARSSKYSGAIPIHARACASVDENGEERLWEIELAPGPRALELRGINEEDFFGPARAAGYISRRDPDSLGVLHILLPDGREFAQGDRESLWGNDRHANVRFSVEYAVDPERAAEERRTATSIFRKWGRRVGPRPQTDEYHHLLTERGREAAAQYYAPRDNPELQCRTGLGASMLDPAPLAIIDEGDRILVQQDEYDVRRTIWFDPEASGVEPAPAPKNAEISDIILPQFPILERFYGYLEMITGYVHYGDQRYLTVSEPGPNDTYPNLNLISNPNFFLRAERFWKRIRATKGKGLINDHSIGIYRAKLRARAISRNSAR